MRSMSARPASSRMSSGPSRRRMQGARVIAGRRRMRAARPRPRRPRFASACGDSVVMLGCCSPSPVNHPVPATSVDSRHDGWGPTVRLSSPSFPDRSAVMLPAAPIACESAPVRVPCQLPVPRASRNRPPPKCGRFRFHPQPLSCSHIASRDCNRPTAIHRPGIPCPCAGTGAKRAPTCHKPQGHFTLRCRTGIDSTGRRHRTGSGRLVPFRGALGTLSRCRSGNLDRPWTGRSASVKWPCHKPPQHLRKNASGGSSWQRSACYILYGNAY